MIKQIQSFLSFEYVQVFEITEWKDGVVFKTKKKGFAHKDRPKQENELYTSLSTSLFKDKETITLDLLD